MSDPSLYFCLGLLAGFLAGIFFVAAASKSLDKNAVKSGVLSVDGKAYRVTAMD